MCALVWQAAMSPSLAGFASTKLTLSRMTSRMASIRPDAAAGSIV